MTRFLTTQLPRHLLFITGFLMIGLTSLVHAETTVDPEQLPPWMQPEQLALIVAVDMDDPQKPYSKTL